VFFIDPLGVRPHETDVQALLRLAILTDTMIACNRSTADGLFAALNSGPALPRADGAADQPTGQFRQPEDCPADTTSMPTAVAAYRTAHRAVVVAGAEAPGIPAQPELASNRSFDVNRYRSPR
jgi:hypothetical protein